MELQAKIYTKLNATGTHYARIVVPKKLRSFVSKPAMWRSLSTKEDVGAIKAGAVVIAATQVVLQEVSDAELKDSSVVKIDAKLVTSSTDITAALKKVAAEDRENVVKSLKTSLGLKVKKTVQKKNCKK